MSVGLEHVDDLWADLEQALQYAASLHPPVAGVDPYDAPTPGSTVPDGAEP